MKEALFNIINQANKPYKSISYNGFQFYIKKLSIAEMLEIQALKEDDKLKPVKEIAYFLSNENGDNIIDVNNINELEQLSKLPFEIMADLQADFIKFNFPKTEQDKKVKK